jgi:hypothetical protein
MSISVLESELEIFSKIKLKVRKMLVGTGSGAQKGGELVRLDLIKYQDKFK